MELKVNNNMQLKPIQVDRWKVNRILQSMQWKGPFDRDLLVFNSFVKALDRSYRNLCEMLVLSLFLNSLVEKERNDYFDIADR